MLETSLTLVPKMSSFSGWSTAPSASPWKGAEWFELLKGYVRLHLLYGAWLAASHIFPCSIDSVVPSTGGMAATVVPEWVELLQADDLPSKPDEEIFVTPFLRSKPVSVADVSSSILTFNTWPALLISDSLMQRCLRHVVLNPWSLEVSQASVNHAYIERSTCPQSTGKPTFCNIYWRQSIVKPMSCICYW